MDNNYKEIRERTSEKLGYVVHRESSRPFLCLENEIERKRQREKKRKRKNNRRYNSFHFVQITESSIRCGATLSFFFFWSKSRGWRSMRSRFHVHERNRSSCLKLWGRGWSNPGSTNALLAPPPLLRVQPRPLLLRRKGKRIL